MDTINFRCPRALRPLFVLAAAILLLAWPLDRALATSAPDAGVFLSELADRAVDRLTEPGIGEAEKERRFRALVGEGFDIPAIGRFVAGKYWRRADPAAQDQFIQAFEDMIVWRFLPLFSDYSSEELQIGLVRQLGDDPRSFTVSSKLARPDEEPIRIDWRVRVKEGRYSVFDIVAEGVSIAVTLRSEYSSFLKQNGGKLPALTEVLRKKIGKL